MNTHIDTIGSRATAPLSIGSLLAVAPHVLCTIGLLAGLVGIHLGGTALWFPVIVLFVLIPAIDHLLGLNVHNPIPGKVGANVRDKAWQQDLVLYAYVPLQLAFTAWGLWKATLATSWAARLGMAIDVGLISGAFGITIAHELMHRKKGWERALAELQMASVSYTWFCIEHVYGHHKHVATPEDAASSRRGEWLYVYLPRTIIGGLRSAWGIEGKRRKKLGISAFSLKNRMFRYGLGLIALYAVTFAVLGGLGVLLLAVQSATAIVLLETINYVEHYGLARKKLANGRYEKVLPKHSWNASHRVSNWMLVNLARHSDHHANANRPFYALRHFDEVPQMPTGYSGMFLMALVPPLWFSVMDPLVDEWNARQGEQQ